MKLLWEQIIDIRSNLSDFVFQDWKLNTAEKFCIFRITFFKAIGHTIQSFFFIRISRLISAKFEEYYLSKQEADIFNKI